MPVAPIFSPWHEHLAQSGPVHCSTVRYHMLGSADWQNDFRAGGSVPKCASHVYQSLVRSCMVLPFQSACRKSALLRANNRFVCHCIAVPLRHLQFFCAYDVVNSVACLAFACLNYLPTGSLHQAFQWQAFQCRARMPVFTRVRAHGCTSMYDSMMNGSGQGLHMSCTHGLFGPTNTASSTSGQLKCLQQNY